MLIKWQLLILLKPTSNDLLQWLTFNINSFGMAFAEEAGLDVTIVSMPGQLASISNIAVLNDSLTAYMFP